MIQAEMKRKNYCVAKMAEWINAERVLHLKRQLQDDRRMVVFQCAIG